MQSSAPTVDAYLAELPAERRAELEPVLATVRAHRDPALIELMDYGMIAWSVPHTVYPPGYHCDPRKPLPYLALAAQKGHLSLYAMGLYQDSELERWFVGAWAEAVAAGRAKKLDAGKACIRFKRAADIPLDVIAELLRRVPVDAHVARYEASRPAPRTARPTRAAK